MFCENWSNQPKNDCNLFPAKSWFTKPKVWSVACHVLVNIIMGSLGGLESDLFVCKILRSE